MSPLSGDTRIAVVGAASPMGTHLREALAEAEVPGERVGMYGLTGGEAVISEYGGEARLIQEAELEEVLAHDVIFLCESDRFGRDVVERIGARSIVIDLAGCLGEPRVVHMQINPEDAREPVGVFRIPHPITTLLSELLYPIERRIGIEEALAVVVRPAADFGQAGLDELRDQTVRLLSFAEVPVETFGRQLAFNILPQTQTPQDRPGVEAGVAAEVQRLLHWDRGRLAIKLITAPVFHGHSLQLRLRLKNGASLDDIREVMTDCGLIAEENTPATPLEVSEQRRTSVAEIAEDGLGGYWIWAVAGEAAARGADLAVRLARALSAL